MRMIAKKRAQEEIIGFVLVVVLVIIISIIFLGIMLRNHGTIEIQNSEELSSFISSVYYLTTECKKSEIYYQAIGDLIVECSENKQCSDGQSSCEVLESTLKKAIQSSTYAVSKDSRISYYTIDVLFKDQPVIQQISELAEGQEIGNCKGTKLAGEKDFIWQNDNAVMKIEICHKTGN